MRPVTSPKTRWYDPGLEEMERTGQSVFGPVSFRSYCSLFAIPKGPGQTAATISLDAFQNVPGAMRQREVMVFRLGRDANNHSTQFIFVHVPENFRDLFVFETDIVPHTGTEVFSHHSASQIQPFFWWPSLTERGLLNLAFASGFLRQALGLEESVVPVTTQSTFTFQLRIHSIINQTFTYH